MRLHDVAAHVGAGTHSARRTSWPPELAIGQTATINEVELLVLYITDGKLMCAYALTPLDFIADDWELVPKH